MKKLAKVVPLFIVFVLIAGSFSSAPAASTSPWQEKVDPWVLDTVAEGEQSRWSHPPFWRCGARGGSSRSSYPGRLRPVSRPEI